MLDILVLPTTYHFSKIQQTKKKKKEKSNPNTPHAPQSSLPG